GCTRCLDVCPTSAISPAGDAVEIDPLICAGCGSCAAVCPTGASSTDDPPVQHLFNRMRVMAEAYTKAGGKAPRLLVHDDHGAEMIRLGARYGRGLPADVIPMEVGALAGFGHAEQLAALALGYAAVSVLPAPRTEREVIEREMALARAIAGTAGEGRIALLDAEDPDALSDVLYGDRPAPLSVEAILPIGGRRDVTRLAATALHGGKAPEQPLALPEGAPYGAILVNTDACTLCLSCVGLCPPGALGDNPDRPELNFRETACVQCGLCATVCPENAIKLVPQLDLTPAALAPRELNSEEPFCCVECGKPFGSKKTIDRITEKLSGVHSMFTNSDNVRLIQMCDDCRIRAQFRHTDNPLAFGERPRVRTTDDYLKERERDREQT
ncbi:MAG TPA: 4Fe-4S binding protein, partial [Paracoccaceae bacterium]|nr:4Fe-4S binding protein [Paracoccaceae bacterium]